MSTIRGMRACMVCSIVKEAKFFKRQGCPNCDEFLHFSGDDDKILECTSAVFEGVIAITSPESSWVAKWQRLSNYEPGLYATKVVGVLPDDVVQEVEEAGVRYIPRDGSAQDEDLNAA